MFWQSCHNVIEIHFCTELNSLKIFKVSDQKKELIWIVSADCCFLSSLKTQFWLFYNITVTVIYVVNIQLL